MIINPIVAAAAVASRAVGAFLPGDWTTSSRRPPTNFRQTEPWQQASEPSASSYQVFPTNPTSDEYFGESEETFMNEQANELDEFMQAPIQDAEILSKESPVQNQGSSNSGEGGSRTIMPPPLPNTNNPFRLLGIEPSADFDTIRRAYRKMAKIYHPDMVVGPDATADEGKDANWDFARINSAYDILKRKEDEEVIEYDTYDDGQKVTRSVVVSEDARYSDHHGIAFDRIAEIVEYNRRHHPPERMWYEEDRETNWRHPNGFKPYAPRNDGFQGSGFEPYTVGAHSRGNWRRTRDFDGRDAHIPSRESRMWEERAHFTEQESDRPGFGAVTPDREQWSPQDDYEAHTTNHNHEYQSRNTHDVREQGRPGSEPRQGYPYKDMMSNQRTVGDGYDYQPNHEPVDDMDYDPQERYPVREKWWKADEHASGDFGP